MSVAKTTTNKLSQIQTQVEPITTIFAVTAAILVGVFLVTAVGFAGPEAMHNAAHDIRHGLAFPCH